MSRCGTFLRIGALAALALASTACLKFTPDVTALSSQGETRPSIPANGYLSSFSGRQATSLAAGYKLKSSLDRVSSAKNTSVTLGYMQKISPITQTQTSGGSQ